jgi:hypothetical protein
MKRSILLTAVPVIAILAACLTATAARGLDTVSLCEPWDAEYAGQDATGPHVIGLWQFNAGAETADASGRGHDATLQDAGIAAEGRFGSCLECFAGWPVEDKRHRALVPSHPALSPSSAFTIEMWIRPKEQLNETYPESFLLDKKYVAHDDYQLILGAADRSGNRALHANLGFGGDSQTYYSQPARFEPGRWRHIAFTYDGAGSGRFYLDGRSWGGGDFPARKALSAGKHPLSIGDRIGSYFHGFPGFIDQVRITSGIREFRRVRLEQVSDRRVFVRHEPNVRLKLAVTNLRREPLATAAVHVSLQGIAEQTFALQDLAPGQAQAVEYPVDTSLRPDEYALVARLELPEPQGESLEERLSLRVVPRRPAHQFPVLMWGIYGGVDREADRLQQIGFTHVLGLGADYARIWDADGPVQAADEQTVARSKRTLDEALARDLTVVASLSPGGAMRGREALQRVGRDGKPYATREDICGLLPPLQDFCFRVGQSVGQTYGHFPAFGGALLHTEVRDHARPCFHAEDFAAFRQHAGFEIPKEIVTSRGVDYTKLDGFPASRVIPDDHPLLVYFRWYWQSGDGWNGLNSRLHEGLATMNRPEFWTFHDPAVRVARVSGSGGSVDVLSQWTYSYPDPIRIAVATDELLATAAAERSQQVMKMTQVIWYRSQTAPEPKTPGAALPYRAPWEIEQPDAPFITIAPLHLREAFWTKIARPIRGIMYHGWQSLVPCDGPGGYRYTHPDTQHELARLIRQVIRPLGPTLLQVPAAKSDVAFLESFASEMFARRGTYGWSGGWAGDCYQVLQYAHLQPEIVLDETVAARGLDGYRVLVMPDCDVLTETVTARIKAFQAAGGIVVGDERTCPAVQPDIVVAVYQRTGRADADKQALQARAAELRTRLDPRYRRAVDTTEPDVIPYLRQYGQTDYVFVLNDRREYGQYVGQHGLVMENGLPAEARVVLQRDAGAVYDLVHSRPVLAGAVDGRLEFRAALGPCDGGLYMVCAQAIAGVRVETPEQVLLGSQARCIVRVLDAENRAVGGVVPVEIRVRDPAGRVAEFSGAYGAVDGRVELVLDIAANDPFGIWQVEARELASGLSADGYFRVASPAPWPPAAKPIPAELAKPEQPQG